MYTHAQSATIEGGASTLLVILPKEKEIRGSRKVCAAIMETLRFEFTFQNPTSSSGDHYAQRTLQPDRHIHQPSKRIAPRRFSCRQVVGSSSGSPSQAVSRTHLVRLFRERYQNQILSHFQTTRTRLATKTSGGKRF